MAQAIKQPGGSSPYLPIVDIAGNIKHLHYDTNAGHNFVMIYRGVGVLSPAGLEQGYTELSKLYEKTSNPRVREEGLAYYRRWNLECKKKTAATEVCEGSVPGTQKKRFKGFPEKWLPDEVVARRNGTSDVSHAGWSPPELETEEEKLAAEAEAVARLEASLEGGPAVEAAVSAIQGKPPKPKKAKTKKAKTEDVAADAG